MKTIEFKIDADGSKVQLHTLKTDRGIPYLEAVAEKEAATAENIETGFYQNKFLKDGPIFLLLGKRKYMRQGKHMWYQKVNANIGFMNGEVSVNDKNRVYVEVKNLAVVERKWTELYNRTKHRCSHQPCKSEQPHLCPYGRRISAKQHTIVTGNILGIWHFLRGQSLNLKIARASIAPADDQTRPLMGVADPNGVPVPNRNLVGVSLWGRNEDLVSRLQELQDELAEDAMGQQEEGSSGCCSSSCSSGGGVKAKALNKCGSEADAETTKLWEVIHPLLLLVPSLFSIYLPTYLSIYLSTYFITRPLCFSPSPKRKSKCHRTLPSSLQWNIRRRRSFSPPHHPCSLSLSRPHSTSSIPPSLTP
jgi:hypothetical protein